MRSRHFRSLAIAVGTGTALIATPLPAADVTPERLVNANNEPQNWLMNHRTYDGQRFSPLARINKDNVKNLKLAYAVALSGTAGDEWSEATPLVEDGFIYVTDSWGALYKIDGRSGDAGHIIWRMDPKQEKQENNRGAALWGNIVISPANRPARLVATDKETGKVTAGNTWRSHPAGEFQPDGGWPTRRNSRTRATLWCSTCSGCRGNKPATRPPT